MNLKMGIQNWSESVGSEDVIYEAALGKGREGIGF